MCIPLQSRPQSQPRRFSASEAVAYALVNSPQIKNSVLETEAARAKVSETISAGLPQISASATLLHYPMVQQFVIENTGFPPFASPDKKVGDPIGLALQLQNSFTGSIEARQMIFNGSYLVGLKASRTYTQLSERQLAQAREEVAEQVLKSYWGLLVSQEQTRLLDVSISRLDSTCRETRALLKNGFVEQIDLNRLEVALNNIRAERQKTFRLLELASCALKFRMGMPVRDSIELSSRLDEINTAAIMPAPTEMDFNRRSEYAALQTQKVLAGLQVKNIQAGYYPSVFGLATLGVNSAASRIRNLGNFGQKDRYIPYNFIGLNVSVPVFDGLAKKYQIQQARINQRRVENGMRQLENGINLEISQANTNLANARTSLDIQKRNLDLAQEVVRVSKVKYQQGVGSNLEVTTAESGLKESQTNYYTALYDFIIAKIDLDKVQGKLLSE